MSKFSLLSLCLAIAAASIARGAPAPVSPAPGAPRAADEAAAAMTLPPGFTATLFAGEPDLVKPVAFCFDDRGRLWVAENHSYPTYKPGAGNDRILIFEDTDGDGHFDKRTVFCDHLDYLTGLQLGFGGVYVCSAPNLLFFPLDPSGDKPAGPPQILLDGWTWKGVHNVVNGLTWGPDGWLYGNHGITVESWVASPGTPQDQRQYVSCGTWRYHPTRRTFEYYCEGTCNPWGLDFNEYGHGFFSSSVVPHLYHMIQGAHFQRMNGHDLDPFIYEQLTTCADHLHWAGSNWTSWTSSRGGEGANGAAGGGHSHAGAMIYLADQWPAEYRGSICLNNIHGNRINRDLLARKGSGYVATHGPDFMLANDKWFRGIGVAYGPDGSVYASDWSETGECHGHDAHRQYGRLYCIRYSPSGPPAAIPPTPDVSKLDDAALVVAQRLTNEWTVRHARRVLQERAAAGTLKPETEPALLKMLAEDPEVVHHLRALWSLHNIGRLTESTLLAELNHPSEYVRGWAIQLLAEFKDPPAAALARFAQMARSDASPLVRLYLASALQRTPGAARWPIAEALCAHAEDAADQNLPLMDWYAVEPLVGEDPARATALASGSKLAKVRELISRRIAAMQ